ncbi:tetratricopeptide repeat protein [Thermodesulfatator atlanticus]
MDNPSSWALEKIFPLLEETVSPLLPVEFSVSQEKSPYPLRVKGKTVAYFNFEETFLPGEWKRFKPLVLAHLEQTFNLLLEKKLINGLPGPEILVRDLEKGPLYGVLLATKQKVSLEKAYALSKRLFFIPSEFFSKGFLKALWQKGRDFYALKCVLENKKDLENAKEALKIVATFGFSYFTETAAENFPLEVFWQQSKKIKRLTKESCTKTLAWVKGPKVSLICLRKKALIELFVAEDEALFLLDGEKEEIFDLLGSLSLVAGVRLAGPSAFPLKELWAAFEHAKRLGGEEPVPFEPYSLHVLGDVFVDLKDPFAALSCYKAAEKETPQPVELKNSLAYVYFSLGSLEECEKALKEAVGLAPEDPMLHYNLGVFRKQLGKEYVSYFKKAYELDGDNPFFAEAYAEALSEGENWSEVKKVLSGLELTNKGKFLLAKALYETGALTEALGLFRSLATEDPENLEAMAYLALLYVQLKGEYDVAEALLPRLEKEKSLNSLAESLKTLLAGKV